MSQKTSASCVDVPSLENVAREHWRSICESVEPLEKAISGNQKIPSDVSARRPSLNPFNKQDSTAFSWLWIPAELSMRVTTGDFEASFVGRGVWVVRGKGWDKESFKLEFSGSTAAFMYAFGVLRQTWSWECA